MIDVNLVSLCFTSFDNSEHSFCRVLFTSNMKMFFIQIKKDS